jgi:hypothetical protein
MSLSFENLLQLSELTGQPDTKRAGSLAGSRPGCTVSTGNALICTVQAKKGYLAT